MLFRSIRNITQLQQKHLFSSCNPWRQQTASTINSFSFLPSNKLPGKPRKSGLTEIRGPYYAPVTATYLNELLSDWGEFVDGVKFAGGSFTLMPKDRLSALIEVAHKHGMLCFQLIERLD